VIWICWIRERSPVEGLVSHEITADNYEQACERAYHRFVGTQGFWTLQVEREPIEASAA
jgi:hypothetical protein